MNNERYNQIIDEAYENYKKITNNFQLQNPIDDLIIKTLRGEMIKIETEDGDDYRILSHEEFVNKCKTNPEFSEKWELMIKETYKLIPDTEVSSDLTFTRPVRKYKLIVVYKNEIIEVYE